MLDVFISLALLVTGSAGVLQPNILHLVSDDMRPQLGCYGQTYMHTPNLDALASKSLQFDFAYTQFAYCAPSRNSFMSGRRPERTKVLNFLSTFRENGGQNWTAMPQFFKDRGYFTTAAGKVYHDHQDDKQSWSYPSNQTFWVRCAAGDFEDPLKNYCGLTDKSERSYTGDEYILEEGLKRLELAAASGKPWWVSIGVHRPHTQYRVPQGFYGTELYPNDTVSPPKHRFPPARVPYMAGNWEGGDINDPAHGCPTCVVPDDRAVDYRRWYYAAVTYADHMLGKALVKLEELGCANNTIVVFHSDHGYQLGELNEWSKKTNTEFATHVPMMIHVPWLTQSHGKRTAVKAELVDLYRTLANLTGYQSLVEDSVQGSSLEPVFHDVNAMSSKVAYSQIGRCACQLYNGSLECGANACARVPVSQFDFMGYTMRTADWRYTAWVAFDNSTMRADWSHVAADELYDASKDNGRDFDADGYSDNVADQHPSLVDSFRQQLRSAVESWY
eukprot:Sspe_Gene.57722::Locus_31672_Transcript_1_1_Confidence_1.000_Length_1561::g.57722::m.57722/K01136/IDS; iduronate 2-sulfatase